MKNTSSNTPLFSIVIATYNSEETLEKCLSSIFSQSYAGYELLVVDGSSSDATDSILKSHISKIDYFIREEDDGVYDAWNKALKQLNGCWTLFLGSDDCFYSEHALQEMADFVTRGVSDETKFIFSPIELVDNIYDQNSLGTIGDKSLAFYQKRFLREMLFSHTGCLHRTDMFLNGVKFDSSFKIAGDYELILRVIENKVNCIGKHNRCFVKMGQGGLSTGSINRLDAYLEALRARRINGFFFPSLGLLWRVVVSSFAVIISKLFGARVLLFVSNTYRIVLGKTLRSSYR